MAQLIGSDKREDGAQGQNRTADTWIFNRTGEPITLPHPLPICELSDCRVDGLGVQALSGLLCQVHSSPAADVTPA